ncbi:MAG: HEAT repeat domain-containing protein, partial [Anaerolineae bacterium]|nr:HEAT repeat domain-containing protein [Anaerolineae bacterium]
ALLLLDGLDELGGERPVDPKNPEGEKFDPRQRFLEALPTNNQILVTCRRQDYVEIGSKAKLNGAITLQPLSEAQIAAYLRGTQALWQAVQNDDGLREMAKTPLLLSFFAFAYQDHPEEAEQLTNLADSPGDLRDAIFERYVRERYEHEARKLRMRGEEMAYSLAATCDILSYLAATSLKNTFLQSENERVENQFGRWEIEFVPQSVVGEPVDVDEFVKQAISINLLFSSEPHWLHFTHLLLRDYFAWAPLFVVVNESWDVVSRAKAVWSLGQISDSRSVEALLQILTNSKEPYNLRKVAATALGNFKDVRAVDALIDVLNNSYLDTDSAYIGDAAASSLGIIGDVRAIALLVRALDHPYPVIWEYAEKALIRMGAPAIDALIHVLLQEPAIRFWGNQIGRVLTQIGIPAIDPLVQALDRMEGMAKYYAVDALCNIGTPALDALRNHFHHFSPETKKQIISSLPRTTDPQVLSILEMALNDKDRKVREKSQDSLEGMGTPEAATLLKKYPYKKNRRQRRLRRGPSL